MKIKIDINKGVELPVEQVRKNIDRTVNEIWDRHVKELESHFSCPACPECGYKLYMENIEGRGDMMIWKCRLCELRTKGIIRRKER